MEINTLRENILLDCKHGTDMYDVALKYKVSTSEAYKELNALYQNGRVIIDNHGMYVSVGGRV